MHTWEVFREEVIGHEDQVLQVEGIAQAAVIILEVVEAQEKVHVERKNV